MKIALVHDQLQEFGGAERVLVSLKKIFPKADIYTAFYSKEKLFERVSEAKNWTIKTSWAARIPFFGKLYSPLRFLAPFIWEAFDFSDYDLVISSSGWYMPKGIITKKPTVHICYLHHPPRYLYGYDTAVQWQKYWPVKIYAYIVNHFLRIWDFKSSQRPDYFIANSQETARRIQKFYRRDSTVIYPPVTIPQTIEFSSSRALKPSSYYVTLSRLVYTKHIDLLIRVSNEKKINLKIVGVGKDTEALQQIAGPTVEFLGEIEDREFGPLFSKAKGFLFASVDEEFGIAPVEAMGYGVPVIALASGGLKETVKDGKNGFLFDELAEDSLIAAINKLEKLSDSQYLEMRKTARKEAEKYSEENFREQILAFVKKTVV